MDQATSQDLVAQMLRLFELEHAGEDRFAGPRRGDGIGRVFGGQLVAQALVAAARTVDPDRTPHSLHASFLRGGSEEHPVDYHVDRALDARNFAKRLVSARQPGRRILECTVSFHRDEEGPGHQSAAMPDVPPPEELEPDRAVIDRHRAELEGQAPTVVLRPRPVEMRAIDPEALLRREPAPAEQHVWFRTRSALPDEPAVHRATLAYFSDMRLMATCLLPHSLAFARGDVMGASLDHSIWFHDDFRADDWLLYAMESPWSGNARGLNLGRIFTRDGQLVASVAQEGMFRAARRQESGE